MKLALLLATLLAAPDDEMIRSAPAIVVATAGPSHVRRAPGGWLETVTSMHVEEGIKGPLRAGDTFDIVELGGVLDGRGFFAVGAPQYPAGERALILLDHTDRGDWTTRNMSAGKFAFGEGPAAGAPSVGSYLLKAPGDLGILPIRWATFPGPVVFFSRGTQPGAEGGGIPSIRRAVAAWTNDAGSNVNLQYGGETAALTALALPDGINSILLGDPAGEIPGSYGGRIGGATLALATGWFSTKTAHSYGGERFYSIDEVDLVVQDGIAGRALDGNAMDHIITHELGHCIGLRHSDEVSGDGGTLSNDAVMASTLDLDRDPIGAALQAWDREAVDAVYGASATCAPPTITGQPQSQDRGADAVTLTVTATGTAPFRVQWYAGARGSTTHPLPDGTEASVRVQPATTTRYWARVSNGCAPAADSDEATVTVNGCPAVRVGAATHDLTLVEGRGTQLFVVGTGGSGLRYQWFEGPSGEESRPLAEGTFLNVTPRESTDYWARITNDCGAFIDGDTIHVTVVPCEPPRFTYVPTDVDLFRDDTAPPFSVVEGTAPITVQWDVATSTLRAANECGEASAHVNVHVVAACVVPGIRSGPDDTAVAPGATANLQVQARGTRLTYQWYEGETFDFTKPLGDPTPFFITPPIDAPRRFWVHITNGCGGVSSAAATVAPVVGRRRSLR